MTILEWVASNSKLLWSNYGIIFLVHWAVLAIHGDVVHGRDISGRAVFWAIFWPVVTPIALPYLAIRALARRVKRGRVEPEKRTPTEFEHELYRDHAVFRTLSNQWACLEGPGSRLLEPSEIVELGINPEPDRSQAQEIPTGKGGVVPEYVTRRDFNVLSAQHKVQAARIKRLEAQQAEQGVRGRVWKGNICGIYIEAGGRWWYDGEWGGGFKQTLVFEPIPQREEITNTPEGQRIIAEWRKNNAS